ncbi:P-loop containing nucleoside triphosphate hydrolase protein [Usnea florida]
MSALRRLTPRSHQFWTASSLSIKRVHFSPRTSSIIVKASRKYNSSNSYGVEAASANVFQDVRKAYDDSTELSILCSLQARYPEWTVTMAPASTGLIEYAKAGQAKAVLDTESQNLLSRLKFEAVEGNRSHPGHQLGEFREQVEFGRYDYQWKGRSFMVYLFCQDWEKDTVRDSTGNTFFILHRREGDQLQNGRSIAAKELIAAASTHSSNLHGEDVLVFDDDEWKKDTKLWNSIQQAKWEDVILDQRLKDNLTRDVEGFFDHENDYKQFDVPWKRGIILHGLPGNGKTISVKALIHGLATRPDPIPTLYVKSTTGYHGTIYAIRQVFKKARKMAPCLLIFEDLDSIITESTRSFFLNEVDGLEGNDGIMIIGSTNYLEKLDAGITKRPSRFDRKYHFDLPAAPERARYCNYWRSRLTGNKAIDFPPSLCTAIAGITDGFSFAYLQEAFISSLLVIVDQQRNFTNNQDIDSTQDVQDAKIQEPTSLWKVMSKQVEMLRNEIQASRKSAKDATEYDGPKRASKAGFS